MTTALKHNSKQLKIPKVSNINVGSILSGSVIEMRGNEIFVDLSPFGVGRVYGIFYNESKNIAKKLKVGDSCLVKIVGLDDGDGFFEIVLQNVDEASRWQKILDYYSKGTVLELEVKDANRGGLIVEVEGIQGFVPASNLSPGLYPRVNPSEKDKIYESLKNLVGKKLKFVIINADPSSNKLILSEKAAKLGELKKILSRYIIGEVLDVRVVSHSPFGVFVRFNEDPPLEGLIHISEIPREIVSDLQNNLKIGDVIKAKLIKIEEDRVGFSLIDVKEDPWVTFVKTHQINDEIDGLVKEKNDIYATIEIDGVSGISFDVEKLTVGGNYKFIIEKLEPDKKSLILKLK